MPDIMDRLNSEIEKVDAWCEKNGHFDKKKNSYDHPYGTPYHHGRRELAVELIKWLGFDGLEEDEWTLECRWVGHNEEIPEGFELANEKESHHTRHSRLVVKEY